MNLFSNGKRVKRYSIYHNEALLFSDAKLANKFYTRAIGLLGCAGLQSQQALIITPCNGVHTVAMRYAIDVIFVDRKGVILKCSEALAPNRFARERSAASVIEVAEGMVSQYSLRRGDLLSWTITKTG